VVIFALAGLIALAMVLRARQAQKPTLLGPVQSVPTSIQLHDGAWYWLEQPKKAPARLVRAGDSGMKAIATAEALPRYAVENGKLLWSARQGGRWTIFAAAADGSGQRALWDGAEEPMGLTLAEGRAYWLHRVPAPVPDGAPFPTLSASLDVQSMSQDGGLVTTVGHLWEPDDGEVLGLHDNALYVSVYRHGQPGCFSIYRIAQGAPAVRIAGESGRSTALLTHDGVVYWLAPSREATNAYCLRRIDSRRNGGQTETLSDWLPTLSTLYETTHGVLCDGLQDNFPALYRSGQRDVFPQALPIPDNYMALAAGENAILLAAKGASFATPTLYWMRLP
jgi:hypothetical protein